MGPDTSGQRYEREVLQPATCTEARGPSASRALKTRRIWLSQPKIIGETGMNLFHCAGVQKTSPLFIFLSQIKSDSEAPPT